MNFTQKIICCPRLDCSDREKDHNHLYIYEKTSSSYCFLCGKYSSIAKLVRQFPEIRQEIEGIDYVKEPENIETILTPKIHKTTGIKYRDIFPNRDKEQYQYLLKRVGKFIPRIQDIFKIPLTYGYNNYILILYPNSHYYQYRTFVKGEYPKYKFPFKVEQDVFNYVDRYREYIFIVEGVFDAVAAESAIALGGKQFSKNKLLKLIELIKDKKVIVCLDDDAKTESFKWISELLSLGQFNSVGFLDISQFGIHDVGEFSKQSYETLLGGNIKFFESYLDFSVWEMNQ